MTLSLSKHPVDYTVNSEQLSLPEFVSAYGKRFPHAAIVTQGYCPVEGEEDSEEFSSGEEGASIAGYGKALAAGKGCSRYCLLKSNCSCAWWNEATLNCAWGAQTVDNITRCTGA